MIHLLSDAILRVVALGAWAPAGFILVYVVATVFLVPGAVLSLAAGAVFGFWRGVALVFIGAVLGSSVAFGLSRRFAHRYIAHWLEKDTRVGAVSRALAGQGFRGVALLRLSPVIPYNILNYILGLTRLPFRDYLLGSIGMLPGTLLYTYSGKVVGDVALISSGVSAPRGPGYYVLLGVGLFATVAVTVLFTRSARASLGRLQRP